MKNKQIAFTKTSNKKNILKQNEKAELRFKRLTNRAGCSKKATEELLKWYTNSD